MSREPLAASDGKDDSFVTVSVNTLLSPERTINNTERGSLAFLGLCTLGCCQLCALNTILFVGMCYDMFYSVHKSHRYVTQFDEFP